MFLSGRVYIYLGKREYISADGVIENIKGVAHLPDHQDFLKGTDYNYIATFVHVYL